MTMNNREKTQTSHSPMYIDGQNIIPIMQNIRFLFYNMLHVHVTRYHDTKKQENVRGLLKELLDEIDGEGS